MKKLRDEKKGKGNKLNERTGITKSSKKRKEIRMSWEYDY